MGPTDDGTESEPRRFRLPRWCKVLGTILLGFAALLIVPLFYHFKNKSDAEARLQEVIAETERLDPRWRFEDIVIDREVIPDDENSAPHVRAVKALLPSNWPTTPAFVPSTSPSAASPVATPSGTLPDRLRLLELTQQLEEPLYEELRNELDALAPALEKARPIATLAKGRHEVVWAKNLLNTLLPHVQDARSVGELLFLSAVRSAHENDCDTALQATRGILNAGRSIGDEPTLISQLVRMALASRAISALERVLARGEASPMELVETQKLMESEANVANALMRMSIRAERGAWFEMMNRVANGEISLQSIADGPEEPTYWNRFAMELYIRPRIRRSQAVYLGWMNQVIESLQQPAQEALATLTTIESECAALKSSSDFVIATVFFPAVVKVMDSHYRRQAQLDCAALGIASERYRQKHGLFPDSLEKLIPDFVEKIPDDPFGEGPIRYRRLDDGVVIYSVSNDGKDDNGALNRERPDRPGADIGIRLWDVKHRRQSPPPVNPEQP